LAFTWISRIVAIFVVMTAASVQGVEPGSVSEQVEPRRLVSLKWMEHELGRSPAELIAPALSLTTGQTAEMCFDDASCRIDVAVRTLAGAQPARHVVDVRVVEKLGDHAVWMAPKLSLGDDSEGYLSIPRPDGSGIELWVKVGLAP
jgi:hypothetical protein